MLFEIVRVYSNLEQRSWGLGGRAPSDLLTPKTFNELTFLQCSEWCLQKHEQNRAFILSNLHTDEKPFERTKVQLSFMYFIYRKLGCGINMLRILQVFHISI